MSRPPLPTHTVNAVLPTGDSYPTGSSGSLADMERVCAIRNAVQWEGAIEGLTFVVTPLTDAEVREMYPNG